MKKLNNFTQNGGFVILTAKKETKKQPINIGAILFFALPFGGAIILVINALIN